MRSAEDDSRKADSLDSGRGRVGRPTAYRCMATSIGAGISASAARRTTEDHHRQMERHHGAAEAEHRGVGVGEEPVGDGEDTADEVPKILTPGPRQQQRRDDDGEVDRVVPDPTGDRVQEFNALVADRPSCRTAHGTLHRRLPVGDGSRRSWRGRGQARDRPRQVILADTPLASLWRR